MRVFISLILLSVFLPGIAPGEDRPFLGVRLGEGATVDEVFSGGPAENAGVKPGDKIRAAALVDGEMAEAADPQEFADTAALQAFLSEQKIGQTLRLTVERKEVLITLHATLVKHTVRFYLTQTDPPRIPGGKVQLGRGTISGHFRTSGNTIITAPSSFGGLTQTWTGILDLKVTKPEDPPPLSVSGPVSLAGLLYVHIEGHKPKLGDRFELIRGASSIEGQFDELMLPELPDKLAWRVEYDDIEKMRDLDGDKQHDVTLIVIDGRMPVVEN